jgi:hypothetical protein
MAMTMTSETRRIGTSMISVSQRWLATVFAASLLAACASGSQTKTDARPDTSDGPDRMADGSLISTDGTDSPSSDAGTPDAAPCDTLGADAGPDGKPDQVVDHPPDNAADLTIDLGQDIISAVDTACTVNAPCELPGGGKGLCGTAGICTACASPQDDNTCTRVYGLGTVCVDGQCAATPCQDSTECRAQGSLICDTKSHACRGCMSDSDCQSDPAYNEVATPYCVSGRCAYMG